MELSNPDNERPIRNATASHSKLIVPLGYAAFVVLPIIGVIIFFVSLSSKPPQEKPERETATEEQTPTKPKTQTPHDVKKRSSTSVSENKPKDFSASSTSASGAFESKTDTDLNSKTNTVSVPKADIEPVSDNIAPPPRLIEYGTLKLTTTIPVSREVTAWVEIDGKRVATWEAGKTKLETKVLAGHHTVKILSIYKNTKHEIFEGEVDVPGERVTELAIKPKS